MRMLLTLLLLLPPFQISRLPIERFFPFEDLFPIYQDYLAPVREVLYLIFSSKSGLAVPQKVFSSFRPQDYPPPSEAACLCIEFPPPGAATLLFLLAPPTTRSFPLLVVYFLLSCRLGCRCFFLQEFFSSNVGNELFLSEHRWFCVALIKSGYDPPTVMRLLPRVGIHTPPASLFSRRAITFLFSPRLLDQLTATCELAVFPPSCGGIRLIVPSE